MAEKTNKTGRGKKRGSGEGTCYQRKDGRWTGQITVGWNALTGKQERKTVYAATQSECLEAMRKEKEKHLRGEEGSSQSLKHAIDWWLTGTKSRVASHSLEQYRAHLEPVKKHLGDKPINRISGLDITRLFDKLEREGATGSQRKNTLKRLRAVFKKAIGLGMLSRDPTEGALSPRTEGPPIHPLTREEVRDLLFLSIKDNIYLYPMILLSLDTGMRQGELLALTWDDWLPDSREVVINKTVRRRGGVGTVRPTKTKAGRRRVPVTRATAAVLDARKGATEGAKGSALIFPDPRGEVLVSETVLKHFKQLLKRAGVRPRRWHDLRHTCASFLLLGNVHPKIVQERLGHASIKITLDTYSHLLPNSQDRAVTALEEAIPSAPAP